jgi:hypothetical protein
MSGIRRVSDLGSKGVSNILDGSIQAEDLSPTIPLSGMRNLIINGDFRINQRGFTSLGTGTLDSYGFDRWKIVSSGGATWTPQTFTPGNAIPGQEPQTFSRIVTSGQSTASSRSVLVQSIEDVRTLAGQTATFSFWAKAASGTPKVAVEISQNFGTGGSPSGTTLNYVSQVTLSTSWVRHTVTFNVPSITGKTIGTTGNTSFLSLNLWVSAGADFNARTDSLGLQSNTFDFWGVQLEQNLQPTPFEQRPVGVELQLCQRYYYRTGGNVAADIWVSGYQPASTSIIYTYFHPVELRTTPTLATRIGTWTLTNTPSQPTVNAVSKTSYYISITVNAGISNANQSGARTKSDGTTYLEFSAEL